MSASTSNTNGSLLHVPLPDRISEICKRANLASLVSEYAGAPARISGDKFWFHCPGRSHANGDRKPSLVVKAGRWRCWSACAAGGDVIDFVKFVGIVGTTREAIDFLHEHSACPSVISPPSRAPLYCPKRAEVELSVERAELLLFRYLRTRGLPAEIAEVLGLRVVVDSYGYPRVRHPFRLRGREVYCADRAIQTGVDPRWLYKKGTIPCPYEVDRLGRAGITKVLVTEGVSDAVTIVAAFDDPCVVGIPGSGGFKSEWAVPAFVGLTILLCADNDRGGEQFAADVTSKLVDIARSVRRLRVPEQYNDLGVWLMTVGDVGRFRAELERAEACAEVVLK